MLHRIASAFVSAPSAANLETNTSTVTFPDPVQIADRRLRVSNIIQTPTIEVGQEDIDDGDDDGQ